MNTKLPAAVTIAAALSLPLASHAQDGATAGATTGAVSGAVVGVWSAPQSALALAQSPAALPTIHGHASAAMFRSAMFSIATNAKSASVRICRRAALLITKCRANTV